LAGKAHGSKVSFLAPPRTHTGGHFLPLATGSFLESYFLDVGSCDQKAAARR
jgi:hypothetical protein